MIWEQLKQSVDSVYFKKGWVLKHGEYGDSLDFLTSIISLLIMQSKYLVIVVTFCGSVSIHCCQSVQVLPECPGDVWSSLSTNGCQQIENNSSHAFEIHCD